MMKRKKTLIKLSELTHQLAYELATDEEVVNTDLYDALTTVLDISPFLCFIISPEHELIYMNPYTVNYVDKVFHKKTIIGEANNCYRILIGGEKKCDECGINQALVTGKLIKKRWTQGNHSYDIVYLPLKKNGITAVLIMASEVTDG